MNDRLAIPPKWLALAGSLLDEAADKFGNRGCNDWEFPQDWTLAEKRNFVRAMHEANGSLDEFEAEPDHLNVPDWWVMRFLAGRLKEA